MNIPKPELKKFQNTDNLWFTSDYHLYHDRILNSFLSTNRSFKDTLEMNEAIRDNHNSVCDKDSIIFNLGDAILLPKDATVQEHEKYVEGLRSLLGTFKGTTYYIPGNHERDLKVLLEYWKLCPQLMEISCGKGADTQHIVLCHYALRTWNAAHYGTWHLHGHSHGGLTNDNGD